MKQKLRYARAWLLPLLFLVGGLETYGQTYCSPSFPYGCSFSAITTVQTTGGVANIDNEGSGCSTGSYGDFTDMTLEAYPGTFIDYTIETNSAYGAVGMYIDWNNDGDFTDAGEAVYTSSSTAYAPTDITGSFEVPLSATLGETRMRVVFYYGYYFYSYLGACYSAGYGEYEDYTVEVLEAPSCSDEDFDTDITLAAADSVCPSIAFIVTADDVPVVSGATRKWQSSPAGDGTWTDLTGSSIVYSSAGITEATDFRFIIACTATGESDTSDVKTIYVKPGTECYCTPSTSGYFYGCSSFRIDNFVTTGGVNNISNINSNCAGSSAYDDNTTDETMLASQWQGSLISYTIKAEYTWGTTYANIKMWVDWDQDGVFDDGEEVYDGVGVPSGTDLTGTFEVPATAASGNTRLRIKLQDSYYAITDPCVFSTYTNGEVEDYNFEVLVPDPCDEVEMTAITLDGPDSICSGENPFTLTAEGTPIASGLTKVWESSPAGEGDWTVIAGESYSYLNVSGITEATDYRFIVTCEETGEEVISETFTVELNPPTECYCDIDYAGGCTWNIYIDDFITTGGTDNISNTGSGCAGTTGYGDYTDQFVTAYQGTMVDYEINTVNTGSVRMWIDWDQSGTFDSDEMVYTSSATGYAPSSVTGSFEVPYDATPGATGIRIRTFSYYYAYDYLDACYDVYGGETEDYTFNVVEPDPCDEVPFTGLTIEGPETICAGNAFTITSEGTPVATGLTRIWQSRTDDGSWTTITGATSLNYTVASGIMDTTSFRYIVTCSLTGESDTSNVIEVTLNPPTECYCEAEFTYAYDLSTYGYGYQLKDIIFRGATDTLTNLNTDYPEVTMGEPGGYTDYSSDTTDLGVPDFVQTGTYTAKVSVDYAYNYLMNRVWIDYDDDGFFDSSDEIHASSSDAYTGFVTDNFSFTIPADANPGFHRMRVRAVTLYSSPFPIDPCYQYSYGETQDYLVEIVQLKPCAEVAFPDTVTPFAWPPNVCGTGDVDLSITTTMPLAAGITYQWKSSSTEDGTYTNVGTPIDGLLGADTTVTGISADTWFKCYVLCEGEDLIISEPILVQSVNLEDVEISVEDGQTCGPGPVTLHGSVTDGSVFWYTDAEGGSPIAMGDSFVTPSLTADAVYYATGGAFGASDAAVGTGSGSSSPYVNYGPFSLYGGSRSSQFLYTAEELAEAGLSAGVIKSVSFFCASLPAVELTDYQVSIKTGDWSTISWQTSGWTLAYETASLMPEATGWVTFPFEELTDDGLAWNGTDDIMIKICYKAPDLSTDWTSSTYVYSSSLGGAHKYTTRSGRALGSTSGSGSTDMCSTTYGYDSYTQPPNAKFFIPGCETDRVAVNAYVRPVPAAVNIGDDLTTCKDPDNGWTLDVGTLPETYTRLWDNGETGQTRRIEESGTYSIEVANEYGCAVYDTVTMTLLDIPSVELGPDTVLCEGGIVILDAGDDGTDYMWSTGAATRTIEADEEGEYTVVVGNENDCIAVDTIDVTISGHMPGIASIVVTNTGAYSFNFEPLLPSYVVAYEWDFGDGETSEAMSPNHTYTTGGSYVVTLTVHSTCGTMVYTTTAHIVGLNNISVDNDVVNLYPNPAHETVIIENKGNLVMKSVTVTNVLGQEMFHGPSDNAKKHQLNLSGYASGMYNVRIETDKGFVVRKFEIIK